MIIIDLKKFKVIECSRVHCAEYTDINIKTLYRWEHEKKFWFVYKGSFIILFCKIEKVKQKKGFAIEKK